MKHPTLSIVIPAYNEAARIASCLEAIAAQTVTPKQVIVVDNNSTDDTVAIAKGFAFVTILSEKKQGVVFARNKGFNAVTADIIGRIDADVRLPVDWVERVQAFYEHERERLGTCAYTGGVISYNIRLPKVTSWVQNQLVFRMNRMLLGHYILFGSNMAVPTSLWKKVRDHTCVHTDIHEDLDLSIHLHEQGYLIAYQATLEVNAKMRRVRSNHEQLWGNLQWWPNTLKAHNNKRWVVAWVGAAVLFVGSPIIPFAEWLARWFGRQPLADD